MARSSRRKRPGNINIKNFNINKMIPGKSAGKKGKKKRPRKKNAFERLIGVKLSPFGYGVIIVGVILVILILTLLVKGIGALFHHSDDDKTPEKTSTEEIAEATTEEPEMEPVSLTVSMVGDCTIGTDPYFDYEANFNAYYDAYGADYFMENVKSIFEEDDLTVANFEGTLTESEERADKEYAFKGPAEYAKILSGASIEAVNLANNHSHDFGDQGFTDTQNNLDAENVLHFGYDETVVTEVKGVKVGLVGIYELEDHLGREEQVKTNIQKVKDEGAQLVIVSFHWGNELDTEPDSNQRTLARFAIDEGADLVVGHHAHVLQGTEQYKGKNIVYGLGNFCFGGNNDPSDLDTMIFQQTFTITSDGVQEDNVTNIIPCSLSSTEYYNNFQPTPVEGEEETRILEKIQERNDLVTAGSAEDTGVTESSSVTDDTSEEDAPVNNTQTDTADGNMEDYSEEADQGDSSDVTSQDGNTDGTSEADDSGDSSEAGITDDQTTGDDSLDGLEGDSGDSV